MSRQRIIWVTSGLATLAVAVGLWLALGPSRGQIQSSSPGDGATIQEAMQVQVNRHTPGASPELAEGAERAVLQEAAEVQVTRRDTIPSPTPPPGAEQTTVSDRVEFIIRDASGKVKKVGP